jgi:diguanylate cyclase (GGDEF)-like protein
VGRQDVARTTADRLVLVERGLRGRQGLLGGAAAIGIVAASAHALLGAPELSWVTAAALATAALVVGEAALVLAVVAAVVHAVVDIAIGQAVWVGAPLVRGLGMVGITALGAGIGVVLRRYEETRRRSQDEDAVTGLLNVRAFYDGLFDLRQAGQAYAILLADIAGMRNLNERYGHPTGTEAMRALGHVLRRSTKGKDLVARLGSDEVAVALVGADRSGALAAARRLARLLADERITLPDGTAFRVHAYYGIATSADLAMDEVSLLRAADHAKLAAKLAGPDEIGVAADTDGERFEIVHPRAPVPKRLRDVRRPPSDADRMDMTSTVVPRPAR